MRVLVACEFSGRVRDAFRDKGHDAWSCDVLNEADLPEEFARQKWPKYHITGNVTFVLDQGWDLMVAHPPCRYLAVSGARWFKTRQKEQADALEFVRTLMDAPISKIAVENPISVISTRIRKPDQILQPWMFGHGETKATCLWLKGLPLLTPTNIVPGRKPVVHFQPPSPTRWLERSRTYDGIATAMAEQWGSDGNV